jgi:hypothetical protein
MDSIFSFFSNKTTEATQRPDIDEEEPTTTEYYSGASDSCSDIESFKDGTESGTQFSLELDSSRGHISRGESPDPRSVHVTSLEVLLS